MEKLERLAVTVSEFGESVGIGRAKAYAFVKAGEIRSIRIGRAVRVPIDAIREFVARRSEDAGEDATAARA